MLNPSTSLNYISEEKIKELIAAAKIGIKVAYRYPTTVSRYGAAVLTESGKIYSSGQYKTITQQIHAEQAALIHAAAHGEHTIIAIAIISDEDEKGEAFTNPCGICQQTLYESSWISGVPIKVILANSNGHWIEKDLSEIISFPWPQPKQTISRDGKEPKSVSEPNREGS